MESTAPGSVPSLVSAFWLASHLGDPDLVVLDCSWYLPGSGRNAATEYQAAHIPGALRFDLDRASDQATSLPHMLPPADAIADYLSELGIRPDDRIVCYDGSGANLSAARVWWMFRVFGHRSVSVLDGGFAAWSSATRPVQRGTTHRQPSQYPVPAVDRSLVRDRSAVRELVAGRAAGQVVDCRPGERFRSEVDEPRAGVARGNIPGSVNLPYQELTDRRTHLMHPAAELTRLLGAHGVDPAQPIVALCGSGTSAAALALAVEVIRESGGAVGAPVAIYDGSWSEWGAER